MSENSGHLDEDDFSVDDLERIQQIFTTFFILVQLALLGGLIWTGWRGAAWYIVIPVGAVLWIGSRTLKKMFGNQFDALLPEARQREAIENAVEHRPFDTDEDTARETAKLRQAIKTEPATTKTSLALSRATLVIALIAAALLPAALWYFVGAGLRMLY